MTHLVIYYNRFNHVHEVAEECSTLAEARKEAKQVQKDEPDSEVRIAEVVED